MKLRSFSFIKTRSEIKAKRRMALEAGLLEMSAHLKNCEYAIEQVIAGPFRWGLPICIDETEI